MKKFIAILMALAMVLGLAACGGDEGPSGDYYYEEEKELSRGTIDGDVYTNEFMGITFINPDGWTYLSDEEIAESVNQETVLGYEDLYDVLTETGSFYDMMTQSASGESVMVGFENMDMTFGNEVSVEEYFESVENLLEDSGYDYTYGDITTEYLSGVRFDSKSANAIYNGVQVYQKYYLAKHDEIMSFIIISAQSESNLAEIEEYFVESANSYDDPDPVIDTDDYIEYEEETTEANKKISKGEVGGNVYYNEFADIKFNKPSDWRFASDEEIVATANSGMDLMDLNDIEAALAKGVTIYDMMAVSSDETNNAMIMFENAQASGAKGMTEEEYIELLITQFESLKASGLNYEFGDVSTRFFAGNIYHVLPLELNDMVYQNMYIRMQGNYVICVTITSISESGLTEIETMFS